MTRLDLGSIGLFKGLSPEEIEAVRPLFDRREFPASARVIEEGRAGSEMFVLVSGRVRVVKAMVLPGVDLSMLGVREPGKVLATLTGENHPVFGEMSLVADSPRSATVETLEPSVFLATDRERFMGLARTRPELGCKLLFALCGRMAELVRHSNAEVVKLTTALALVLSERR